MVFAIISSTSHPDFPTLAQPPALQHQDLPIILATTTNSFPFLGIRPAGETTAKLTGQRPLTPSHDRYEFPSSVYQRQQRAIHQQPSQPTTPDRRSTATPSSIHRLRRTPRFSASPISQPEAQQTRQPIGKVTVTLSPKGQYVLASTERQPRRERPKPPRRQLSQGNLSDDSQATSISPPSPHRETAQSTTDASRPQPHPALRISKQTHSAILYALEQTLRGPKPISDDPVELYAPMSDLMGGRGPATSNGNGASSVRPTTARAAVGSPSGIRGPRVIMQERAAREAARERQREEQERERQRMEREHADAEARLQEQALRREAERKDAEHQATAAGAGPYGSGAIPTGADPTTRRPAQPAAGRATADNGSRPTGQTRIPTTAQAQAQAQASQSARHARGASTQGAGGAPSGPGLAGPSVTQSQQLPPPLSEESAALGRGRNSFPHAFERWETLSAHWEGLTSFWIRRLEQNAQEINQDPVSAQLSRQVTDLSSAGANLFHAVVELQRLRASSERKFQRWFFDTRADIERSQEVTGMLEAALEEERRTRADAIREALERNQDSSKMQKQISELRKELTISKEEARRAWEELGRREQEERDRTMSLQLGQPTIVGGVQVVPMTQGMGRGTSQRDPRSYGQPDPQEYSQSPTSPSAARAQYTQAPAVKPGAASGSGNPTYQTPTSVRHQQSYGSEGTYSEGQYINGMSGAPNGVPNGAPSGASRSPVRDFHEHNVPEHAPVSKRSDVAAEEFETPATQPSVYQPTGASGTHQPQYSSAPDYSGAGYTTPWDDAGARDMGPRHHHPTRLSDVLEEEEERSRTSASQSQVSRP
ncbi:uncharacterized protein F4807DRAFT_450556 [Annulohypoxylon truncatum]|uniref:uncharacterized protein n=1 Tax=Annulohypoxylon truncatum TaxID=327061 RepID=UPI002007BB33|nr:uncharacterized protein F4807DRAFT_450556 [Annulohypoxylon truncatum]KAI1211827.1 hypothetical protein F4807DRAFT_450556 [Annulohypoxylon truncatum]